MSEHMFQGLGDLPGGTFYSLATGVSADGRRVVGLSASHEGDRYGIVDPGDEAFLWTPENGIQALGTLSGGVRTRAAAISADGRVIVGSAGAADGTTEAFVWTQAGGMQPLAAGGLAYDEEETHAVGVSGDGAVIVGYVRTADGNRAFRWLPGRGLERLEINADKCVANDVSDDGRVVVGSAFDHQGRVAAYAWTPARGEEFLGILHGGGMSIAAAVSADGATIVGRSESVEGTQAFRWTRSRGMQGLGDLPGGTFDSRAYSVTGDGSAVVGASHGHATGLEAFVWTEKLGLVSLREQLMDQFDLDLKDWSLAHASDISADGRVIVGSGYNPLGETEAWIVRLPEPLA